MAPCIICMIFNVILVAILCDKHQIPDTRLDILFILDQEQADVTILGIELEPQYCSNRARHHWCYRVNHYNFTEYANYKLAYDGVNSWVESILHMDRSSEIHFAVVHSCSQTFSGVVWSFKDKNFKHRNMLSSENAGINPGCKKNFPWTMNLAVNNVFTTANGRRPDASAIVIVVSDCLGPPDLNLNDDAAALNNFYEKVKGRVYFVCYDYKQRVMDKLWVRSTMFKIVATALVENNGQSQQSMIYVGDNSAEVGRRLDELMPKRSGVKNVDCAMILTCTNCTPDINGIGCHENCSWVVKQRPTGTGKPCVKHDSIFQQNCTCSTTTPMPTEGPKVLPVLLGVAIALLSADAILVLVVCFVRAKKNKRRTKERGVDSVTDPASMHSDVENGSKVEEMSIRGPVVQSVRKDVNSVSKPMETTKLIASKSAAKKYAKSMGSKSTKSLMQKPANSKSLALKNKIPSNY